MGIYLNPDNSKFKDAVDKKIYVDKSLLIDQVWMYKERISKYLCVSRPRKFGKSTDANMLVAYYSKGCDSHDLFDCLNISNTENYLLHLNKHHVIHLNMQDFLSDSSSIDEMLELIKNELVEECVDEFYFSYNGTISLPRYLAKLEFKRHVQFIFIIDEWDCIFRDYKEEKDSQKKYFDFLRNLLKDKSYVECVYMTGILPIKNNGSLNIFDEISMLEPQPFECFMGFTEVEVQILCNQYSIDYSVMKEWYGGYQITDTVSTFSPRSVIASITREQFSNYWNKTENFEALKYYIDMNFDGLKESVMKMIAGESVEVYVQSFSNNMTSFQTKDDIFALLIHLGYLTYSRDKKTCRIPNKEVADLFIDSIRSSF